MTKIMISSHMNDNDSNNIFNNVLLNTNVNKNYNNIFLPTNTTEFDYLFNMNEKYSNINNSNNSDKFHDVTESISKFENFKDFNPKGINESLSKNYTIINPLYMDNNGQTINFAPAADDNTDMFPNHISTVNNVNNGFYMDKMNKIEENQSFTLSSTSQQYNGQESLILDMVSKIVEDGSTNYSSIINTVKLLDDTLHKSPKDNGYHSLNSSTDENSIMAYKNSFNSSILTDSGFGSSFFKNIWSPTVNDPISTSEIVSPTKPFVCSSNSSIENYTQKNSNQIHNAIDNKVFGIISEVLNKDATILQTLHQQINNGNCNQLVTGDERFNLILNILNSQQKIRLQNMISEMMNKRTQFFNKNTKDIIKTNNNTNLINKSKAILGYNPLKNLQNTGNNTPLMTQNISGFYVKPLANFNGSRRPFNNLDSSIINNNVYNNYGFNNNSKLIKPKNNYNNTMILANGNVNMGINCVVPSTFSSIYRTSTKRTYPGLFLQYFLEECFSQFKCLEKERKKCEAELARTFPGRNITSNNSIPVPGLGSNPSRIDRMIVDHVKEHAKILTLLNKMQSSLPGVSSVPVMAHNIIRKLEAWFMAIKAVQIKRKEEIQQASNVLGAKMQTGINNGGVGSSAIMSYSQPSPPKKFQDDKDILALSMAIKELGRATKAVRSVLWSSLHLAIALGKMNIGSTTAITTFSNSTLSTTLLNETSGVNNFGQRLNTSAINFYNTANLSSVLPSDCYNNFATMLTKPQHSTLQNYNGSNIIDYNNNIPISGMANSNSDLLINMMKFSTKIVGENGLTPQVSKNGYFYNNYMQNLNNTYGNNNNMNGALKIASSKMF